MMREDGVMTKGEQVINANSEIIDSMKEKLGVDISFFYGDTRIITTICDDSGKRIVGTKASERVVREVLTEQKEQFYPHIMISDIDYFAYYSPVYNQNGQCAGMIFVAKPAEMVGKSIRQTITPIIFMTFSFMVVIGLICMNYSHRLIKGFSKIENFLHKVSGGDLTTELDESLIQRKDEMGEMARHIVDMQQSFRELVEKDSLTGLNNRRCGEYKLSVAYRNTLRKAIPYVVAIGDIDFFKRVNDNYGHAAGDLVLKNISEVLNKHMQGKGSAARWGGEEFLLIFDNMTMERAGGELQSILEDIRKLIVDDGGRKISVTMTFGAADNSVGGTENILKNADERLYYGKAHGRNQVVIE